LNGTTARVNGVVIGATPVTTNFFIGGLGAGWGEFSLTSSGGFVFFNLAAMIPEPSPFALVSVAVFCTAVHRRLPRNARI